MMPSDRQVLDRLKMAASPVDTSRLLSVPKVSVPTEWEPPHTGMPLTRSSPTSTQRLAGSTECCGPEPVTV
jgi:hypothetical protein